MAQLETLLMVGPSISEPTKIVEREIPLADVEAYRRAGYTEVKEFATAGIVYTEADAAAQAEVNAAVEAPAPKRGRKAR